MTFLELFTVIRKHLAIVVITPIAFALVAAIVTFGMMPDEYTAEVSMYVLSRSNGDENAITNTDLTASQMLTNDVAALTKSSRVQRKAAEACNLPSLGGYQIGVSSSTSTRVITIYVTGESPANVAVVANVLAATVDETAQEIMEVQSVNVIDEAVEPLYPSGPSRPRYIAIAFLAGLVIAIIAIVIADKANTRVRSAEEASEMLGLTVIGRIPIIRG